MNAPELKIPRLTSLAHGGGCGCKLAPGVLESILANTAKSFVPKELLVGIETSDDAAVYQINETQAIVATTDFFMPIVDDPFDFGAIAATNAISDVYAMGGTPLFALAIVGMPIDKLPVETHPQDPGGRRVGVQAGRHPDRRRTQHRLGGADLRVGGDRAGQPQAHEAQRGRPPGRQDRARARAWAWASTAPR